MSWFEGWRITCPVCGSPLSEGDRPRGGDDTAQSVLGAKYVDGQLVQQTYPVTSGVVDTCGKMEFTGGYVQVSMKAPSGDGSWPGLWLLPGESAGNASGNFEIDMQEGGYLSGSGSPNDTFAYHLHTPSGTFGGQANTGVDLTAGYNTYRINWVPGKSITWYLNCQQVGQITSAQAPIPNEPMELIMSNSVANSTASGWRTTLDSSTPQSMPMQIGDVQLYQAPGNGDMVMGANVSSVTTAPTPPTLSIANSILSVTKGGGTVDLAISVTAPASASAPAAPPAAGRSPKSESAPTARGPVDLVSPTH